LRHFIQHTNVAIRVTLLWLLLAGPALAQSPADCPGRRLETGIVEGLYLGRECPNVCYVVIQLDGGEKLRLMDSLGEAEGQLGQPGERLRLTYDIMVSWNVIEQYCEDSFIFKSARPVVREEAAAEAGEEDSPPAATEEECPTQILMLGEARGVFLGEVCQGGCQVVLHLDDGQELRLDNEGQRRLDLRETLGQPGNRVAVTYEQARSWNSYRGLCQIRDRLVSGRAVEAATEAAESPDGPGYDSWW
jgi:hypothetical protein